MKKTLLIIVVLLFATNLQSQTSVLSDFFTPSSIEKTIIREYVSPYTISYIKTKTDNYFCYSDETNTSVLLKTNSKLDDRYKTDAEDFDWLYAIAYWQHKQHKNIYYEKNSFASDDCDDECVVLPGHSARDTVRRPQARSLLLGHQLGGPLPTSAPKHGSVSLYKNNK